MTLDMRTIKAKPKQAIDANTRARLLRVATKLFATKGYDRVSVRELAKAGKCNLSMISYYFGGKEKLYLEVFNGFFDRVSEFMAESDARSDHGNKVMTKKEFTNEIRTSIRFLISEFRFDPYAKILIHREVLDGFPRAKTAFVKHFNSAKERMSKVYDRAQASGHIKKNIDIPTFLILLNRSVEAYLVAHMFARPFSDVTIDPIAETEKFVDQVEEIFLRGVLS